MLNIHQWLTFIGATPTTDQWMNSGIVFQPNKAYLVDSAKAATLLAQTAYFRSGQPTDNRSLLMPALGFIYEATQDNVTATPGGGQTNAYQLTAQTTRITVVATAGDSVKLPPSFPGLEFMLINHGANAVQVYGSGTDTINDVAAATGVSHMPNSVVIYICTTAGVWNTEGLANGFAAGYPTTSAVNGLIAKAGGGQAGATLLTATINRVTTVATIGDSVLLPASVAGMMITVTNAAANSMNVFPGTGDAINGAAANAAYALAGTKTATLTCAVAGQWHAVLSA